MTRERERERERKQPSMRSTRSGPLDGYGTVLYLRDCKNTFDMRGKLPKRWLRRVTTIKTGSLDSGVLCVLALVESAG